MCNGESRGSKKSVDTFHVALLGFSLISIIVFTYSVGYLLFHNVLCYQESFLGISTEDIAIIEAMETIAMYTFILPMTFSLMLWYVMPSFLKDWYTLEPLPHRYRYVYDIVKKIALKMEISPPNILYTPKGAANCFNLGKRESESTIVISEWLLHHVDTDELEAIFAHEMAHTRNRDVTLMAYFAAVSWVILLSPVLFYCGISSVFQFGSFVDFLFYSEFWVLIVPFFLLYFFLVLGIRWFSRVREATADAQASLVVDRKVLKRAIYRLASTTSMRMMFVPSCLMASGGRFGGIFFTHPTLRKRFQMLDRRKYIIDPSKSPSLRSCFASSVSLFLFIQLINYIVSALCATVTGNPSSAHLLLILSPFITAILLTSYYGHIPLKYYGAIIFFTSSLQVILPLLIVVPSSILAQHIYPFSEGFSSEARYLILLVGELGKDLWNTAGTLSGEAVRYFISAFLITVVLKYIRKYVGVQSFF